MSICRSLAIALCATLLTGLVLAAPAPKAQYPALPSETPAEFKTAVSSWDFTKRDVMIAMRDGVKLHTVLLIPKVEVVGPSFVMKS